MAATRFYTTGDDPLLTSPTPKGTWTSTSGFTQQRLSKKKSGSVVVSNALDIVTTNPNNRLRMMFISGPLKAQTINGNLLVRMLAHETDAAANAVLRVHAWVTVGDTDVARGTLITNSNGSTEFVADATNYNAVSETFAISSLAITAGDRLVIEIGVSFSNSVSTSYTGSILGGGLASDLDGTETGVSTANPAAGYCEFDTAIATQYETVYITADAAPVTPAATRGTWNDTASAVDASLGQTTSGATAQLQISETVTTNPYDVLHYRLVSDKLAAQTIAGTISATLRAIESSASADAFVKIHAYIMAPDGSVRATVLNNVVDGTELGTINVKRTTFTLSSQTANAGDRLVIELGSRFTNAVSTSFNTSHYRGNGPAESSAGQGPTLANSAGWLEFESGLIYLTQTPRASVVLAA